ncbi:clathrin interactor EPSIN 3-like [Forsythia ovata]|uniref:Clathrin interactor EPSIN 3-like n=1 Tax=Forsythia ovata TaxID=205694 RepID=A0ABD1UYG7_9LAMI
MALVNLILAGSFSAIPATSNGTVPTPSGGAEMDLLGSFSEPSSSNSLALVSAAPGTATSEANASLNSSPPFDDPFGDGPFKAIPSTEIIQNAENDFGGSFHGTTYTSSGPSGVQLPSTEILQFQEQELSNHNEDIDILADILPPSGASPHVNSQTDYPVPTNQPVSQTMFPPQTNQPESQSGLLSLQSQTAPQTGFHAPNSQSPLQTSYPPSGASPHANSQTHYLVPNNQPMSQTGFPPQSNQPESQLGMLSLQSQTATQTGFHAPNSDLASMASQPPSQTSYPLQPGQSVSQTDLLAQANQSMALTFPSQTGQTPQMGFPTHSNQAAGFPSQMGSSQAGFHAPFRGQFSQPNANFYAGYNPQTGSTGAAAFHTVPQISSGSVPQHNFLPQSGSNAPVASQMGFQAPQARPISTGSGTVVPQPSKDKFETKSTVWADTLSRGLVNLNISGPKINPLADIGVDFDAINRKEKRMEKPTTSTVPRDKQGRDKKVLASSSCAPLAIANKLSNSWACLLGLV